MSEAKYFNHRSSVSIHNFYNLPGLPLCPALFLGTRWLFHLCLSCLLHLTSTCPPWARPQSPSWLGSSESWLPKNLLVNATFLHHLSRPWPHITQVHFTLLGEPPHTGSGYVVLYQNRACSTLSWKSPEGRDQIVSCICNPSSLSREKNVYT